MPQTIQALVVDLGDVQYSWHPPENGKVSAKVLKRAMSTRAWYDFECGMLSEEDCYCQIEELLTIPRNDFRDTIEQAKMSLRPDQRMLQMLKNVKDNFQGETKIYLMSNISQTHWEYARSIHGEWDIFDQIFTSAGANMRKPDLCFYKHVLKSIGLTESPSSTLFIDDKLENIGSARALGMQGLVSDDTDNVIRQVWHMPGDPIARGTGYLRAYAKRLRNFAQLLILENTNDRSLVAFKDYHMLWNFFQDEPILTTTEFPNDYDTTSLALAILDGYRPPDVIHQTLDASLYNQFPDHLLLVYDDPSRPRFDPIVCVHIYILFLVNHRSHELTPTWNYTCDFLEFSAYEQGTYYYASPEYFLYALARMILYSRHREIPLPTLRKHLVPNRTSNTNHFSALFRARCRERINAGPSNAIGLALQIIACRTAGITPTDLEADAERLRTLQEIDGGWPWCEIYRAPSANAGIGSRGVVTSFAVRALQMMDENRVYGDLLGETQTLALGWRSFWRTSAGSWLLHLPMSLKDALPKTISIVCIVAQAWLGSKMHLVLSWGRGASS